MVGATGPGYGNIFSKEGGGGVVGVGSPEVKEGALYMEWKSERYFL